MKEFQHITKQLVDNLSVLEAKYRDNKEIERSRDYFIYVKSETEELFNLIDLWAEQATSLVQKHKLSLFTKQITATKENMEALIMHSYYKDVRKRQYMEISQACDYIFSQCLEEKTS